MNSTIFHPHYLHAPAENTPRQAPWLDDAHAVTKALERWENEGGRIPEVHSHHENARARSSERR